jgi:hypothetical protein
MFFRPFQVAERVSNVAYHLHLSDGTKIQEVLHVGHLKKFTGNPPVGPGMLPPIHHGRACLEPEVVLKSQLAQGRHELLVQWKGHSATDANWFDLE